jgi:ketosteroid isomerase-like protein
MQRRFIQGLLLLLIAPMAGSVTAEHTAELRHIKEVLWPQAYRENDVELLARILHPDFSMISADGSWRSRADELDALPDSTWPHEQFEFQIRRLDVFQGHTAVISGQGRASGQGSDGPYCFTYQSSNVLIRDRQDWRAVASHVSGLQSHCE